MFLSDPKKSLAIIGFKFVSLKEKINPMITKEQLLNTISSLPDKISFDDLLDRIILLERIETGLTQSENGKVNTTEQAKEKLSKWLK